MQHEQLLYIDDESSSRLIGSHNQGQPLNLHCFLFRRNKTSLSPSLTIISQSLGDQYVVSKTDILASCLIFLFSQGNMS